MGKKDSSSKIMESQNILHRLSSANILWRWVVNWELCYLHNLSQVDKICISKKKIAKAGLKYVCQHEQNREVGVAKPPSQSDAIMQYVTFQLGMYGFI